MSANELSATLWRQRELLEMLLFKYDEQALILSAGKTRWAPHASREIEVILGRLETANLATSVAISAVARDWGLAEDVLLRDLVNAAPDTMWRDILTAHLDAVVALIIDIRALRDTSVRDASDSDDSDAADERTDGSTTYTPHGTTDHTIPTARLIDASL